jgi:hypothetical protein
MVVLAFKADQERRRGLSRERLKRFRARKKAREGSCTIAYPAELIDMLLAMRWLEPNQAGDIGANRVRH